jgi:hypothetical protein
VLRLLRFRFSNVALEHLIARTRSRGAAMVVDGDDEGREVARWCTREHRAGIYAAAVACSSSNAPGWIASDDRRTILTPSRSSVVCRALLPKS